VGCGCGGGSRQVVERVPREQLQRAGQVGRPRTVGGDGTVWNGPQTPAPPEPAAEPDAETVQQ